MNLANLDDVSLKRYWRVFQLSDDIGPAATKEELVTAINRHFTSQVGNIYDHTAQLRD